MESVDKYIDLIMIKFYQAMGYSEIPQEKIREIIKDYLLNSHDEDMQALAVQMEVEQLQGKEINAEFYKKEYSKIKAKLNDRVRELSYIGEDRVTK